MKIDNDEQYKLCKDILLIREIEPNISQSIFTMNYNKLSESKQEILDEKYCCQICKIFIKQEKPLICYRCQKIFHQKCLTDWDNKKKSQNQKLSCPNCRKELPIELWEKKLDFEDEKEKEIQLLEKIRRYELNKRIDNKVNQIKEKQFEELFEDLRYNYKKIFYYINKINSLIDNKNENEINLDELLNNLSSENIRALSD